MIDPNKNKTQLTKVMLEQMVNIRSSCRELHKPDLSIPNYDVSKLLNDTLNKYKNDLLTPKSIDMIKPLDKKVGWRYSLLIPASNDLKHGVLEYKGEENGEYYFDYADVTSSPPKITGKYKWV